MATTDFALEALIASAGVDPWEAARALTDARPDVVATIGSDFDAAGLAAADVARLGRTADEATAAAHTDNGAAVYDVEESTRIARGLLADDGDSIREVGRAFRQLAEILTEHTAEATAALDTTLAEINAVVARRDAQVAGVVMPPEQLEVIDRGYVAEAVGLIHTADTAVQNVVDSYEIAVRSRTALLADLGYAAAPTTADNGVGFVDGLVGLGQDLLNGAASFGKAALTNPLAGLGLAGGSLLAGVSAAGVGAGGLATATGVGAPVGVPLTGLSAAGLAAGVGLAGVSGAALVEAARGADAVDLFAANVDQNSTTPTENWQEVHGEPLAPDQINLSPQREAHILDSDETGGGHFYGTGIPDKSEFPKEWGDDVIVERVLDVGRNPDSVPIFNERTGNWEAEGVREGVVIRTIVGPDGYVHTAHPLWGPGVERNDENGDRRPVPDQITYRELEGK